MAVMRATMLSRPFLARIPDKSFSRDRESEDAMTVPRRRPEAVDAPDTDEVRRALDGVLASDVFRGSPQLAAFLRYVVEATLRGEGDRIKGYTIAIEALGRDDSFDPQTDPIVRVEAARLRRAITRYYGSVGSHDTVQIDLPLGSYVPEFRRVSMVAPRRRIPISVWRLDWRRIGTSVALILLGAAIYALLDFWFDFHTPNPNARQGLAGPQTCAVASCPPAGAALRSEN